MAISIEKLFEMLKQGEDENLEFKLNISSDIGRVICGMLNTGGGAVLLGIEDSGKIIGITRKYKEALADIIALIAPRPSIKIEEVVVDEKIIVAMQIPKSTQLHAFGNVGYIRIGSTTRVLELKEIVEKAGESLLINFDSAICPDATEADIDERIVKRYLSYRAKKRNVPIPKRKKILLYNQLGIIKNNRITNAGILFFSTNPQRYCPQSGLRIIEFQDETTRNVLDEITLEGNLWTLVDKTEEILNKKTRREAMIKGFERIVEAHFPIMVIREAVLNALVHRNYFDNADVRIFIFPQKIEIINPGSFPSNVSVELPVHRTRNPVLCQYFYDIGYIEKYGTGLIKMREWCKQKGFPEPDFDLSSMQTKIVLHLVPLWIREKIKTLDKTDKKIVAYLFEKQQSKAGPLIELTNLSRDSLVRRLNILIEKGIVKKSGIGKGTTYAVS